MEKNGSCLALKWIGGQLGQQHSRLSVAATCQKLELHIERFKKKLKFQREVISKDDQKIGVARELWEAGAEMYGAPVVI